MPIFSTFDGLSLHFEIVGEGSPVVLLHGFASSYEVNWRRPGVVRVLLEAGHQVIGLNARGHEGSDAPHDPRAYSNGAMVNDVVALFDHLSLSQSDVVGYSMGALTAFAFAQRDRRVRRLVLGGIGGYAERLESVQDDSVWAERSKRIADALETDDPSSIGDIRARGVRRFADWRKSDRYALAAIQRSGG